MRVTLWFAVNLVIALACAAGAYLVVALAGEIGLRLGESEAIDFSEYLFTIFLSPAVMWWAYMGLLLWISLRSPERFRLWAILLCPLLGLLMTIANLAITAPEVQAVDLAYVLFALTVRPFRVERRSHGPTPAGTGVPPRS